jgi:cell division protein ZapA
MGYATITVNGRSYRLRCGDGEEARLAELAQALDERIDRLAADLGQHGDERLLLIAALKMADEISELRSQIEALEAAAASAERDTPSERDVAGVEPPKAGPVARPSIEPEAQAVYPESQTRPEAAQESAEPAAAATGRTP